MVSAGAPTDLAVAAGGVAAEIQIAARGLERGPGRRGDGRVVEARQRGCAARRAGGCRRGSRARLEARRVGLSASGRGDRGNGGEQVAKGGKQP